MKFSILLLTLVCCAEIPKATPTKLQELENERNVAVWGADDFKNSKNKFPSDSYPEKQVRRLFLFFHIPTQKVSMVLPSSSGIIITKLNDTDRINFLACLGKYSEWSKIATIDDNITKNICSLELEILMSDPMIDLAEKIDLRKNLPRTKSDFDFRSIFGEKEFIVTIHNINEKLSYNLNNKDVEYLIKSISDESIKRRVAEFTKEENRLNSKFK
ncbi:hypothetical protein [Leptospira levettii]|uniref:hypothetical protein n=1 Tax=Leptospira levettii TaxID=2023178 RepID=UPI00223D28FA|nr:hypothetical protein [Leptospira levettii]MCW7475536.1 hypothetical protein [Leptospira levettii]